MDEFHYALIRVVPDPERMEPVNVGMVLQGQGRIDFKLRPHDETEDMIDPDLLGRWHRFFVEEICGEHRPLFQPEKNSAAFLRHLANLCQHTLVVTRPLLACFAGPVRFDDVLGELYERLVKGKHMPEPLRGSAAIPTRWTWR